RGRLHARCGFGSGPARPGCLSRDSAASHGKTGTSGSDQYCRWRNETMKGSCLCGAVQYEAAQVGRIGHCHCITCRKAHAAAFASTARVNREHFRWVKGENKLASFEFSPGRVRRFCSVCGSHLVAERATDPHVVLRVATLDEDPGSRPGV